MGHTPLPELLNELISSDESARRLWRQLGYYHELSRVCTGALLQCSFGIAHGTLNVLPTSRTLVGSMPMANIMDNKPFVNILPFAMCNSIANPTVAAATAAALGVLTPMPCIPATPAPRAPGSPRY